MTINYPVPVDWSNHKVIEVNNVIAAATNVALPPVPTVGMAVTVKDYAGNASMGNITILGSIDSATNYVMSINSESITVYWNGTRWNII